ncbi:hypothetical protein D3C84_1205430 [compost metagenome]
MSLQANQLFFKQGQSLGYTHQHPVEGTLPVKIGRNERHRVERQTVAHQVFLQCQACQM